MEGRDARDPVKDVSLPIVREGNLDIIWNVAAIKGLSLRLRNAYVAEGGPRALRDFRIIANYELPLL